jgi:serine-type D-Ala-D-Ala carboxypeptidase/endopeptidase (penicillin-binding protein 4)
VEIPVSALEASRERPQPAGSGLAVDVGGQALDPSSQPSLLGVELERTRIAVGERMLNLRHGGGEGGLTRSADEAADAIEEKGQVIRHRVVLSIIDARRSEPHGPQVLSSASLVPTTGRLRAVVVLLALLVGILVLPALARAAGGTLATRLERALSTSGAAPARIGAVVVDLATGEPVYVRNGDVPLAPASNEKLPVTVTALLELGAGFRYTTEVLGRGSLVGGVWRGDIVLRGSGDPTLHTSDLAALAQRVREAGIRRLNGRVLADDSLFDAERGAHGWKAGFLYGECPPLAALTVERAETSEPALAAAEAFERALERTGVRVDGTTGTTVAGADTTPLAEVSSEPLWRIIRRMNHESDNFLAEMLLKEIGVRATGRGTTASGAAVVRRDLASLGVAVGHLRLLDGSGLAYGDRLTPSALVSLLVSVWNTPRLRRPVVASLAVAGVSGTLDDRLRQPPARGTVVGKTGTTRIASSLSGFVGERYAFAILMNGNPLQAWSARASQDRFVELLAAQ